VRIISCGPLVTVFTNGSQHPNTGVADAPTPTPTATGQYGNVYSTPTATATKRLLLQRQLQLRHQQLHQRNAKLHPRTTFVPATVLEKQSDAWPEYLTWAIRYLKTGVLSILNLYRSGKNADASLILPINYRRKLNVPMALSGPVAQTPFGQSVSGFSASCVHVKHRQEREQW